MTSSAFVAAIKTQMAARLAGVPALSGVTVLTVPDQEIDFPVLVILRGRVIANPRYIAQSMPLVEDVTVPGIVLTNGSTIEEASAQALAVVAEIVGELRSNPPVVGDQTLIAQVPRIEWLPAPSDRGGWDCSCEYDITYSADLG